MIRIIIIVFIYSLFFVSCSNSSQYKEEINREEIIDNFVSTLDHAQLVSMLIIENDFDYSKISEVLNCSSFVLKRISDRRTNLNDKSEVFVRSLVCEMLLQSGKKKFFDKKNAIQKRMVKELGIEYLNQKKMKSYEIIIDEQWEEVAE